MTSTINNIQYLPWSKEDELQYNPSSIYYGPKFVSNVPIQLNKKQLEHSGKLLSPSSVFPQCTAMIRDKSPLFIKQV